MTIEKAIKKAIEGGYDTTNATGIAWSKLFPDDYETFRADILLDHLFWHALGKAMGWIGLHSNVGEVNEMDFYMWQWHNFIDHLADGGTAESFFQNLI